MKYIFCGPTGSGKSTLLERWADEKNLEYIDIYRHISDAIEDEDTVLSRDEVVNCYHHLCEDILAKEPDAVEIGPDWPSTTVPLVGTMMGEGTIFVYIYATPEVSKERLRDRGVRVPDEVVDRHYGVEINDLWMLSHGMCEKFIRVENVDFVDVAYDRLKNEVEKWKLWRR